MAEMRPSEFQDGPHKAEVFERLKAALPDEVIVVCEPPLFDRHKRERVPDFVLFWPEVGCVILEARDWPSDCLVEGDVEQVSVRDAAGGAVHGVGNPFHLAKEYTLALQDHLKRDLAGDPRVIEADGERTGHLSFCVTQGIVLAGCREENVDEVRAKLHVPAEYVLTADTFADPERLREKIRRLPRPFETPAPCDEALRAAADCLYPPDRTPEQVEREKKAAYESILPSVSTVVTEAPEWEEVRARYDHYRGQMLHVCGEVADVILADNEHSVLASDLHQIMKDLEDDEFRIGLFGVIAAGKSTFINALLGERVLRPGTGETTKTIMQIKAPVHACTSEACDWTGIVSELREGACPRCGTETTPLHAHGSAVLTYKSAAELEVELRNCLESIQYLSPETVPEGALDVTAETTREMLRALIETAPSRKQPEVKAACSFIKNMDKGWDAGIPMLGRREESRFEDLNDKMYHEEVALYVRDCTLYYDSPLTRKRFVLIDSPGLGSNLARHTNLSLHVANKVDAAVLITKVGYAFKRPDIDFIWDLIDTQQAREKHNMLFVLNQIGLIDPLHVNPPRPHDEFDLCVNDERDRLLESIEDEGLCEIFRNIDPYPVDAACAFYAERARRGELTDEERTSYRRFALVDKDAPLPDPDLNRKASRFGALEKDLVKFVTGNRYVLFLENRLNALERTTENFRLGNQEELDGLTRDIDELNERLRTHNQHYRRTRSLLEEYVTFALDAKVRKRYEEGLEKDIGELIDMASALCAREYRREAGLEKLPENVNANQVFARVVENVRRELIAAIREARTTYHAAYRQVRDEAINARIPEIVREYGEHINWTITSADIDYAELDTIRGLEHLRLNLWQRLWAAVRGGDEARAEMFRRNFADELGPILRKDLTGWINRDLAHTQDHILCRFDSLMNSINQRILEQMQQIQSKEKERDGRWRALLHYEKQCDRALDKLNELRSHIETLRPRQPHLQPS